MPEKDQMLSGSIKISVETNQYAKERNFGGRAMKGDQNSSQWRFLRWTRRDWKATKNWISQTTWSSEHCRLQRGVARFTKADRKKYWIENEEMEVVPRKGEFG